MNPAGVKRYMLVEWETNAPETKIEGQYRRVARHIHDALGDAGVCIPLREEWSRDGPVVQIKLVETPLLYDPEEHHE